MLAAAALQSACAAVTNYPSATTLPVMVDTNLVIVVPTNGAAAFAAANALAVTGTTASLQPQVTSNDTDIATLNTGKLSLTGGTMSGTLDMGYQIISNIQHYASIYAPTSGAATYAEVRLYDHASREEGVLLTYDAPYFAISRFWNADPFGTFAALFFLNTNGTWDLQSNNITNSGSIFVDNLYAGSIQPVDGDVDIEGDASIAGALSVDGDIIGADTVTTVRVETDTLEIDGTDSDALYINVDELNTAHTNTTLYAGSADAFSWDITNLAWTGRIMPDVLRTWAQPSTNTAWTQGGFLSIYSASRLGSRQRHEGDNASPATYTVEPLTNAASAGTNRIMLADTSDFSTNNLVYLSGGTSETHRISAITDTYLDLDDNLSSAHSATCYVSRIVERINVGMLWTTSSNSIPLTLDWGGTVITQTMASAVEYTR